MARRTGSAAAELPSRNGPVEMALTPQFCADARARSIAAGGSNRPFIQGHVAGLRRALRCGKSLVNNDAICIAQDGRIISGHHRLYAAELENVELRALVWLGCPNDLEVEDCDGGRRWELSHYLAYHGVHQATRAAGVVKSVLRYYATRDGHWLSEKCRPDLETPAEQARWAMEAGRTDRIVNAVRDSQLLGLRELTLGTGYVGMVRYLTSLIDQDESDRFWEGLVTCIGQEKGSPILVARAKMLQLVRERNKNALTRRKSGLIWSEFQSYVLCVTWNVLRGKAAPSAIRIPNGDSLVFPMLDGWRADLDQDGLK